MHLGFNQITSIQDTDFPLWITEANIESNRLTELINASCPENSKFDIFGPKRQLDHPLGHVGLLSCPVSYI